ncbi:hypothetical protein C1646_667913 [Rhizophagus diaphanus]|nr:hypothetical protein C1646_667913 [Rhizophagus diaphanus] [Rhizophagus sp. MUCL 43196]
MSFSDFSSQLEKVIILSEEIVKSCQSAKNHEQILENFENKVSEALKIYRKSKERDNNNETQDDEIKVPTDVDEMKVPTDDDEMKVPTDDDEMKVPTDDDEMKISTDDDEIKVPTDDDEIKVPTSNNPTDVDEMKVPTDDDDFNNDNTDLTDDTEDQIDNSSKIQTNNDSKISTDDVSTNDVKTTTTTETTTREDGKTEARVHYFFLDRDFNAITSDSESKRDLKDIIITNSNMEKTIYLKNCELPDLEHFKTKLSLEYGRTLTPINTEIKIADNKAFTIKDIKSVEPNVTISYETVKFNSKDTWEKKNINDVSPAIGIPVVPAAELNVGVGFSIDKSKSKSTSSEWKYSSLIGGEPQNLHNFDEEKWINSLFDYKNWKCIEFQEPIHIFQLLDDNLREKVYKILGKKILYRDVISISCQLEYGERKIVGLPLQGKICKIIRKEAADCSVFATIVGDEKNDFYNCQIYHPRGGNEKPKLVTKKNQRYQLRHNLKIGFMIIGYDFDFPNGENDENDDTRLEVHYQDYQNLNDQELTQFSFDRKTFLGIPVLNELNDSDKSILIGHYFLKKESTIEANVFSYSLKENKYVKLPCSFRFQVLVSGISKIYESIQLKERFMRFMRQRRYESIKNVKNIEKILYISVYSANCGPVFLKQKNKKIKLKYADCKCKRTCTFCNRKLLENDIRCTLFVSNKVRLVHKFFIELIAFLTVNFT